MPAVYGSRADLKTLLDLARTRRVDFVGLHDSNGWQSGDGWDEGIPHGLNNCANPFDMYATQVSGAGARGGGTNIGYRSRCSDAGVGSQSTAPAALHQYLPYSGSGSIPYWPHAYQYIDPASTGGNSNNGWLFLLENTHPIGVNGVLRAHLTYGEFSSALGPDAGGFTPTIRTVSPSNDIKSGARIFPGNKAAYGLVDYFLDTDDDPDRSLSLNFRPFQQAGDACDGPFFALYYRWERPSQLTGFSYTTMMALGGTDLNDYLSQLQSYGQVPFNEFMRQITRLQNGDPVVCFWIQSGYNDDNVDGSAWTTRVQNLVSQIETYWQAWAGNTDNLYFLIMPAHPHPPADDPNNPGGSSYSNLPTYGPAAGEWAATRDRTFVLDLHELTTWDEMRDQGWYKDYINGNSEHLSKEGYEQLGIRSADALEGYANPAVSDTHGLTWGWGRLP